MMSISARVRSPNRTRSRRKFVLIKRKKIAPEQRKTVLAGQKKNVVLVEKRTCEPPMHPGKSAAVRRPTPRDVPLERQALP
jgi:hypothetical protein